MRKEILREFCWFLRGCLHGGRKILEGETTFRLVYMQKVLSRWKWRMKGRWRATDNKHVIWVLLLSLLALITSFKPIFLLAISQLIRMYLTAQRFRHCCRSIARYFLTLSLVWAVSLWNKTGLEYYRRSSESLESSCGNARRNRRPLAAEYHEHPAAMFVCFFCLQYQELLSERSLHGARVFLALGSSWLTARKILALGPSTTSCM